MVKTTGKSSAKCSRKLSHKILAGIGISAIVGGIAFAGLAHAGNWGYGGYGNKGQHMMQMFDRFDTDGDGKVTMGEIESTRQAMFGGADSNNDSSLTMGEFESLWLDHMRARMVDRFQMLDDDGDTRITEAEFARPMDHMASRLDRNDDGVIEMKELKRRHFMDDDDDENDDAN